MWRSLGQHDAHGQFRIEGVTGPDEYSAVKDNNVYTNLMAQHNLARAADLAEQLEDQARALGVTTEETASWRNAAENMYMPYDERLEVHPQHDGFTHYARWDFDATPEDNYPMLLHYPYVQLYRKQVVKQADVVLAMQVRGDAFTPEQKLRNFDYYEGLTVRDSSLSACTQAVMAAEVGHLQLAYDYLAEAALMDLDDLEHNTKDGLHIASLAGAWTALVGGFGGMRIERDGISFRPQLPPGIMGLSFRLRYRGRVLHVEVLGSEAKYSLLSGPELEVRHYGDSITVSDKTISLDIPSCQPPPPPSQPAAAPRKPAAPRPSPAPPATNACCRYHHHQLLPPALRAPCHRRLLLPPPPPPAPPPPPPAAAACPSRPPAGRCHHQLLPPPPCRRRLRVGWPHGSPATSTPCLPYASHATVHPPCGRLPAVVGGEVPAMVAHSLPRRRGRRCLTRRQCPVHPPRLIRRRVFCRISRL